MRARELIAAGFLDPAIGSVTHAYQLDVRSLDNPDRVFGMSPGQLQGRLAAVAMRVWGNGTRPPLTRPFIQVKFAQQCGTVSDTKNLIDCSDFKAYIGDLKVCVVVCGLRLIVERVSHMRRDTDAHGSIYICAQIIGKQCPDLKQCERE